MVKRLLFITGPPGSGKSTLAQAVQHLRPALVSVLSTSSLVADDLGCWRKLGAMYPNEQELERRAERAIEACVTRDLVIDGAPRDPDQLFWLETPYIRRAIVVLSSGQWPSSPQDLARHALWYGQQVHKLAAAIQQWNWQHLIVGRETSANAIVTWWDATHPMT